MSAPKLTHNGVCYWCPRPAIVAIVEDDGQHDQACEAHARQYLETYTAPVVIAAAVLGLERPAELTPADGCDYCGRSGCHWSRHSEACADVRAAARPVSDEASWSPAGAR